MGDDLDMRIKEILGEYGIVGNSVFVMPLLDILAENGVWVAKEEDVVAVAWEVRKYYKGRILGIIIFLRDNITIEMEKRLTEFVSDGDKLVERLADYPWNITINRRPLSYEIA